MPLNIRGFTGWGLIRNLYPSSLPGLLVVGMVLSIFGRPMFAAPSPEQPSRGGILVKLLRNDAPTFDPDQEFIEDVHQPVDPAYNGLVIHNPLKPEEIIPDLAKSWTLSPDGKTLTFILRENVKWHDGEPFSSADVKFTLERLKSPPPGVLSPFKGVFALVESVETPNPTTARIRLSRPSSMFFSLLALTGTSILPKHVFDAGGPNALKDKVVGTGPFKVTRIERGVEYDYERNPNYFKPALPYLDGIRMIVIRDLNTAANAIVSGQIQIVNFNIGKTLAEQIKTRAPQVQVAEIPSTIHAVLILNVKKKPFNDPRVREAVSLTIDRELGIRIVERELATIGGVAPAGSAWALPRTELLKFPEYSLPLQQRRALAKAFLNAAGYPTGFDVEWVHRSDVTHTRWAQFVRDQLAQIGIRGRNIPMEEAAAFAALRSAKYDLYTWYSVIRLDDPTEIIGHCCVAGGDWNVFGYDDPEVARLWEEQDQTVDHGRRLKLTLDIQRKLLNDRPWVWAYWWRETRVWWPQVQNYVPQTLLFAGSSRHEVIWLKR